MEGLLGRVAGPIAAVDGGAGWPDAHRMYHGGILSVDDEDKAVVLLSGGLDSTTVLALATREHAEVYALSFSYGQRHGVELEAARRIAKSYGVREHVVVEIDLRRFGGSALTDDIPVPKDRSNEESAASIPPTYVPARNTVFLSFGMAWAEVLGARSLYSGVNAVDYSGYPDCRPEFIAAFEVMANLATKAGVEGRRLALRAPLIEMQKSEIIKLGVELGVDYGATHSCYDPGEAGEACGRCDSCGLRRRGFEAAGLQDPRGA